MASNLSVETSDGIAVVTLNRPEKRNALSIALRDELVERLSEWHDDVFDRLLRGAAGPRTEDG